MANVSVALATARTLLNDDGATIWTDAVLLPKLQEAHRELQCALWEAGSPVVREESSALLVMAGQTDLGANQPADLVAPFKLWEASASTEDWVPMTEVDFIPLGTATSATLTYWAWRKEKILFLGATANRRVKVQYRKSLTLPVSVNDPIGIIFGEIYLGARTAALAAGSVGNKEVLAAASQMAANNFNKVIVANRGRQSPPDKP
jgi:hypothetical protein